VNGSEVLRVKRHNTQSEFKARQRERALVKNDDVDLRGQVLDRNEGESVPNCPNHDRQCEAY
jgi:hypothetical protein